LVAFIVNFNSFEKTDVRGQKKIKIMDKLAQTLLRSTDSIGYICCYAQLLVTKFQIIRIT